MDHFTQKLAELSQQAGRKWLGDLLSKKIAAAGVTPTPEMVDAFVKHALDGGEGKFMWGDGLQEDISLVITNEDMADFDRLSARIQGIVPELIENVSKGAARDMFKELKRRWPEKDAYEYAVHVAFQERLEERWGSAFSLIRMLHAISLEFGEEAWKRLHRSRAKKPNHLRHVLLRLHARACQVLGEIIALMENGFADGALARWRTLHEIAVVTLVLADAGEETAKRYLDHEAVEAKLARDLYEKTRVVSGARSYSKHEHQAINREYEAAKMTYGASFAGPYGWAADHLKNKAPEFKNLEDAAGRASLRSHYKMASYNVHAGVKGISFRLGLINNRGVMAGASNVGFDEPGVHSAQAMTQINIAILGPRKWTFDQLVSMRALILISAAAVRDFRRADRQLRREEEEEEEEEDEVRGCVSKA